MEEFDLSQFDATYKTTQIAPNGFDPVPDGKYQVNVDKVELTRSRSGNPVLKWQLKILGPTCRNRILWHQNMIMNEKWTGYPSVSTRAGRQTERATRSQVGGDEENQGWEEPW
jgi:hypothetical protein